MTRTVNLNSEGVCGASFVGADELQIVTGCQDGRICIRDITDIGAEAKEVRRVDNHPIHCVAANPKRDQFAIGDKAGGVHIYQHPEAQGILGARLQLPVLALSYNGTGEKLAAGGDDECIHIINIKPNKDNDGLKAQVLRKLKAVPHTRGLSYDSQGEFVAALSASGLLQVWEMMNGKQVLNMKKAGPEILGNKTARAGIAWHPEGLDLATAGPSNDIILYERHNWHESSHLDGEHSDTIACLAFSPNGMYLASAALDNEIVLWDLHTKEKLAGHSTPATPLSLVWKPKGNALMCSTAAGRLILWENCIPDGHPGPLEVAESPVKAAPASGNASGTDDDDDEGRVLDNEGEAGLSGNDAMDGFDAIMNDDGGMSDDERSHAEATRPVPQPRATIIRPEKRNLQRPFQSGAFPQGDSDRRWLCYNLRGGVSLKEDSEMNILDTTFHDTVADNRRVPPYRDYNNFQSAAFGDRGVLFARRGGSDEDALLMWRPFQSPYANSEWNLTLQRPERIEAIAVGKSFLAVTTSLNRLRLFTTAGLQLTVTTMAGPVVTLAAKGDLLAVVWHGPAPPNPTDQSLRFAIYNANHRSLTAEGCLPISSGSVLTWLAFTEELLLASYDSKGILRVRTVDFGGSWTPLFDSANHQQGGVTHWPVAVTKAELYCIVSAVDAVPTVLPRPILTRLPLTAPVAGADGTVSGIEGDWIRLTNHLAYIRSQKDDAADPDDLNDLEAEELQEQTDADRCVLKLFQDALKTGRLQRAQELAACLHLERSLQGALKLTNLHKIPLLAERISRMLESLEQDREFETPPAVHPLTFTSASAAFPPPERATPSSDNIQTAFTEASENIDPEDEGGQEPMEVGSAPSKVAELNRTSSAILSQPPSKNPFARKGGAPLRENNSLFKSNFDDDRGKRKATENPFMRQPKSRIGL